MLIISMVKMANGWCRAHSGRVWVPVNDGDAEIAPKEGADILSTIDVNLQDVAQAALKKGNADQPGRSWLRDINGSADGERSKQ